MTANKSSLPRILFLFFIPLFFACGESTDEISVVDVHPTGEMLPGSNITWTFSKDAIEDSLVGKILSSKLVTFDPEVRGEIRWIDSRKLRYFPDSKLKPSTQYKVVLSKDLLKDSKFGLAGNRSFEFSTQRVKVLSASLNVEYNPSSSETVDLVSSVEFNYPVDPKELKSKLEVRKGSKSYPIEMEIESPSRSFQFYARDVERGQEESEIQLHIKEGLKPIGGDLGTLSEFVRPVSLPGQEDLRVYSVKPIRSAPGQGTIAIDFNIPIGVEAAQKSISIDPSVDFSVSVENRKVFLRGPFLATKAYNLTIGKDILAIDGTEFKKEFSQSISFLENDIDPQLEFLGHGFYLTRGGNLNVGINSVNVEGVSIEVDRVFENNIVHLANEVQMSPNSEYWYYDYLNLPRYGEELARFDVNIESVLNDEVLTPISVEDYLDSDFKGIYRITARMKDQRWIQATRYVMATDIGLIAKKSKGDLWVWAQDLISLGPTSSATVRVYSQNNQLLGESVTDENGLAILDEILDDSKSPAFLLSVEKGEDISFLELSKRQVPTASFEVDGRDHLLSGYDAFLFGERDIYRPGETAHLASIIRGKDISVPQQFPLRLKVLGPDGRTVEEQKLSMNEQAASSFDVKIPDYYQTGRYTASLLIGEDQEIGRTRFSVEEFIPDRMKVSVSTEKDEYLVGEKLKINVNGMTLFGPPAAGRLANAKVELEAFPFAPKQWQKFSFGDASRSFTKLEQIMTGLNLDSEGDGSWEYVIPSKIEASASVRAVISSTVLEPGGRGVTDYSGAIIHPSQSYVGIRKVKEGYSEPGDETEFEVILTDTEGVPIAGRNLSVVLERFYWNSSYQMVNGRYRWKSERTIKEISRTQLRSNSTPSPFSLVAEDYGQHRVTVTDGQTGGQSSFTFYSSGWGYAPWSLDEPEKVEIDLDKEIYSIGDKAIVQIRSPFPGKLILTVERDEVLSQQILTIPENTATASIDIDANFKPNVYISATLIRSTRDLKKDTPVRAFGIVPLEVSREREELKISFDAPTHTKPNEKLVIDVKVDGGASSPYVAIAAVDEGILQLTDFQTPDPLDHYYGKRRLEVNTYDVYDYIMPELRNMLLSTAGDIEAKRKRQLSPQTSRRVKPVAFWSGLVKTDRSRKASIELDIPEFNGTLRLMAVAFNNDNFGSAKFDTIVRDEIVLTPTFPRFLAPEDEIMVPVSIFNGTGSDATFTLEVEGSGPVEVGQSSQEIRVTNEREAVAYVPIKTGSGIGEAALSVKVSGAGKSSSSSVQIPVRFASPSSTQSARGSIKSDEDLVIEIPSNLSADSDQYQLSISGFPGVKFASSLSYLLRYPHGCLEQTTSRVFPLLYYKELVSEINPESLLGNSSDYFIEEGISKIESMQMSSGAFSYWPGGSYPNDWSTSYATHFLVEARMKGYEVSDRVFNAALSALRTIARASTRQNAWELNRKAYAAYILALAGKPDRGVINYLHDIDLDKLDLNARYLLAGAFAEIGNKRKALDLLPNSLEVQSKRESGRNFSSPLRSKAIMLNILADLDPQHPNIPVLVEQIDRDLSRMGRNANTQERAFSLIAMGKTFSGTEKSDYTGEILVDGVSHGRFTEDTFVVNSDDWKGKRVELKMSGSGLAYYQWTANGIRTDGVVVEADNDLVVRRRYLTESGSLILKGSDIKQGELIIAEISIKSPSQTVENIAVVDMLPAGLEIENPRLESRQGIKWIGKDVLVPDYMDIRDDRMVFYTNLEGGREYKMYYGVRAVTAGDFILPPVRAEAMYAPEINSIASSGKMKVLPLAGE